MMKRALLLLSLLVVCAPAHAVKMWGCAHPGERRNVIILVDRASGSYVKFSGQRVNAQLTADKHGQRWTWGTNSVLLTPELTAHYYQDGTHKGKFKCKRFGAK